MIRESKKYTVTGIIVTVICTMLLLSSCGILISYIDTKNSTQQINEAEDSINEINVQIHRQNTINDSLFTQFTSRGIDTSISPYLELQKIQNKMLSLESNSNTLTKKMNIMAIKFKVSIAGKSRITEESPDWKQVYEFYDNYKDVVDDIKDNGLDYKFELKKFMSLSQDNNIFIIKISDITKQMNDYNKQMQQRSNKIEGMIYELNHNIKGKYTRTLSDSQISKIKKLKKQINEFSEYFNYFKQNTVKLISKVNLEISGYDYLWTEPGMKVRSLFDEIELDNKKINDKVKNLQSRWNSI